MCFLFLSKFIQKCVSLTFVVVYSFDRYMVTSGMDKKLKVYDIRAFKPLKSYFIPAGASCLSLSQRGLLSAATGDIIQVCIAKLLQTNQHTWVNLEFKEREREVRLHQSQNTAVLNGSSD